MHAANLWKTEVCGTVCFVGTDRQCALAEPAGAAVGFGTLITVITDDRVRHEHAKVLGTEVLRARVIIIAISVEETAPRTEKVDTFSKDAAVDGAQI